MFSDSSSRSEYRAQTMTYWLIRKPGPAVEKGAASVPPIRPMVGSAGGVAWVRLSLDTRYRVVLVELFAQSLERLDNLSRSASLRRVQRVRFE